jgi:flavin-dependent dehydrogenase
MGSPEQRQPILILGGGPTGLAAALHVVKGGGSALVVERGRYDELRIGEHLPPDGVALARVAGLCGLGDDAHIRSTGVNAWWGSDAPNYMDYLFHPVSHGLNLSRPHFDASFAAQCRKAGVHLLTAARLINVTRTTRGWRADVRCNGNVREYRPQFVIDATGRCAAFASLQGASIEARDSQVALSAFLASNLAVEAASTRIVIESAEHGWWYFAPLSGGRCVCMFMTDADLLLATPGSAIATWKDQLQRAQRVRSCIEGYPVLTNFVVRPARSQRLDRIGGPGWLAVGDAAMAFDPLSSYGIAKGLEHGRQAAEAVLSWLDGDQIPLQRLEDRFTGEFTDYEKARLGYYSIERRWPHAAFWRRRQVQGRKN